MAESRSEAIDPLHFTLKPGIMKWYFAKIVFQIICGDGNHTPQFDEQLRLIHAPDEDQAIRRAKELGVSEEDCFPNDRQQLVRWQFVNISEFYQLSLIDGAELCSRIYEVDDAASHTEWIHAKAGHIEEKQTHGILQII